MLGGFSTIHKRNLIETKNIKIGTIWATAEKLSSNKCNNYLLDRVSTVAVKSIIFLLPTHGKHRVAAGTQPTSTSLKGKRCVLSIAWNISGAGHGRTEDKEPGIEEKSALHSKD